MKIHYLPKYSEDWHWVASIQGLEVLDVSFMDINNEHLDSRRLAHGERIYVDGHLIHSSECNRSMQQIETDIAENADINFKLVTGVTYDISKKKKKKKKSHSDWGGKWGGKASNWGAFAPHAPPPLVPPLRLALGGVHTRPRSARCVVHGHK